MAKRKTGQTKGKAKPKKAAKQLDYDELVSTIAQVHSQTQRQAVQAVNLALTLRNWLVGYYIVEYEQNGSDRARYGKRLLDNLTGDLRKRLGHGFGRRNLFLFREFYMRYPIVQSMIAQFGLNLPSTPSVPFTPLDWQDDAYFERLFRELPWTHFIELTRMDDPLKRAFYEVQTLQNRWSVRELKRQINSLLYERVGLSRDHEGVLALAQERALESSPTEMIRDPYVFEFLGLKREDRYTESQLERALLDHVQEFLLEMGKGVCSELSESGRDGRGRKSADWPRRVFGKERDTSCICSGWTEQSDLCLSIFIALTDTRGTGGVRASDPKAIRKVRDAEEGLKIADLVEYIPAPLKKDGRRSKPWGRE